MSYDLMFAVRKGKRFESKRVDEKLKKRRYWTGSAPQSGGIGAGMGPKKAVAAELVDGWVRNNVAAVTALAKAQNGEQPWMRRDASMGAWRYMYAREQIQKTVSDSVYAKASGLSDSSMSSDPHDLKRHRSS